MKVVVVLPAYNEQDRIAQVVSDLQKAGFLDCVVVDDGSTDQTAERAIAAGATCLRQPINRGQGAALQTGTTYALTLGADIIVHFDADGQHQPSEVKNWIAPIVDKKVEVVFGSRFLAKTKHLPLLKRWAFKLLIPWHNRLTGVKLTDIHNGARVLSRTAAELIVIKQDAYAHNTEIVKQVGQLKLAYCEVPTEILYHRYGQSLLSGGWPILRDLFFRRLL